MFVYLNSNDDPNVDGNAEMSMSRFPNGPKHSSQILQRIVYFLIFLPG